MNQLRRAMSEGTWVLLEARVRDAVANGFVAMSRANTYLLPLGSIGHQGHLSNRINDAQQWVIKAKDSIFAAIQALGNVGGEGQEQSEQRDDEAKHSAPCVG